MKKIILQIVNEKNITKTQAAKDIGITRTHFYHLLNGKPIGKRTAKLVEEWSGGRIKKEYIIF